MKPDTLASIMNWSKGLYVFMLSALIVFSAVVSIKPNQVEGGNVQTTEVNHYNNTTTEYYNNTTIVVEPEWFSQGGIANLQWNEPNQPGEEENRNLLSSYNFSECEDLGGLGTLYQTTSLGGFFNTNYTTQCDGVPLTSVSTVSGEMLIIHEATGFQLNTTCNGVTVTGGGSTSSDEWRGAGHSMDCTHVLFVNDITESNEPILWSVAYSFRNVTVV